MSPQSGLTQDAPDRTQPVGREVRVQVNTQSRPRFELSVPKVIAGALAAASAAVAASWLGVGGTVIGAVVASLVASVTTAVYSHPLEKSSQVIRETLPVFPMQRPDGSTNQPTAFGADGTQLLPADPTGPAEAVTVTAPSIRRHLQWGPVLVSALVTLVIGVGILTGTEALLGRPISSVIDGNSDGGTTIGHLVHNGGSGSTGSDSGNGNGNGTGSGTKPQPSVPTDTQPTDPSPTEPTPTQPTPTEPTPTEPTTSQPAPTGAGAGTPTGAATTGGIGSN